MSLIKTENNGLTFTFSRKGTFNGRAFYDKYKNAEFLTDLENIKKILSQRKELQDSLVPYSVRAGADVVIDGMFLKPGDPLVIKKPKDEKHESDVADEDFTVRRLAGLAAAALSERPVFIRIPEAEDLGVGWGEDPLTQKLYLSSVSGAEYFVDQFDVLPFICALRKFQLKKMDESVLLDMAMIPCANGEPAGRTLLKTQYPEQFEEFEKKFSGAIAFKIENVLKRVSEPIRTYIMSV